MNFFLSLLGVIGSPSSVSAAFGSVAGGWVRDSSYAVDDGSAAAMHVSIALLHTAEAEAALEAVFNAVSEPGNKVRCYICVRARLSTCVYVSAPVSTRY